MNQVRKYATVAAVLALLSIAAVWLVFARGYTLYYGDAEAHLNIARRWIDSRTPGPEQLGTVWLPVPHLLMTPLVFSDRLWRNGLAGIVPSAACFIVAGLFLFASAQRLFANKASAWAAVAVFALNPNMLYLQAIPMTESVMAAALAGLLWATLWYRDSLSVGALLAAVAASLAASLTRYEGWFLIPFVTLFFLTTARKKWHAILFAGLAALGPLSWLAHNQFYWSDALAFYHGPYSAIAIYARQLAAGMSRYPGDHHWLQAIHYYFAAMRWVIGWPALILALCGFTAAVFRPRLWWSLALLALSPIFYVISMHSSGTPIYVPDLWPFSWYNTRYGLAALPLAAIGIASLVDLAGTRRPITLIIVAVAAITPGNICWKESQVNSEARREWTRQAADYLRANYKEGSGIIYTFGDLTGVLRQAGVPLRDGLHQDNRQLWNSAVLRPEFFLHEEWALVVENDPVDAAIVRAKRFGLHYELVKRVIVKDAASTAVIKLYQRRELESAQPTAVQKIKWSAKPR